MNNQSVAEYKDLRGEVQSLKDCITKYVEFVLGGAGLVAGGAGLVAAATPSFFPKDDAQQMQSLILPAYALVLLVISVVVTMLTALLFYKFHSHNRYVGYCKLLAQERYSGLGSLGELHLWEPCIARLRQYDGDRDGFIEAAESIDNGPGIQGLNSTVALGIHKYTKDDWKHVNGLLLFIKEFFSGRGAWPTWGYPVHVTAVLFTILLILLVASSCFFLAWLHQYLGAFIPVTLSLVALALSSAFAYFSLSWLRSFRSRKKLYCGVALLVIVLGIVFLSIIRYIPWNQFPTVSKGVLFSFVSLTIFVVVNWAKYFNRLFALMDGNGNHTVEAFCWKFMVIRYRMLQSMVGEDPPGFHYTIFGAG